MALAQYSDVYWFPTGALAKGIPARVFPLHSNTPAALFADAAGTQPLPNPVLTGQDGRLTFWAEADFYWIHIDSESFRVGVGVSDEGVSPADVAAAITAHNHDTTHVHGFPDTALVETHAGSQARADQAQQDAVTEANAALEAHNAQTQMVHGIGDTQILETQASAQGRADDARTRAVAEAADHTAAAVLTHSQDTTAVHGIPNTAALETQTGAQTKATAARDAAVATASQDTATQVAAAAAQGAAALDAHNTATQGVHGIADTSLLLTTAAVDHIAAGLAAHIADTTAVHGIPDTAALETQAGAQAKANTARDEAIAASAGGGEALAAHIADTTAVHGIPDTAALETQTGAQAKATAARTEAQSYTNNAVLLHNEDTANVHGIPDTAALETQTGAQAKATAAQAAAEATATTALTAHAATTTAIHGIPNTAALETQTGAAAKVSTHAALTTNIHGIPNTAQLETQTGAQTKATAAQTAAINDAATRYLNRTTGGTVAGDLTVTGTLNAKGITDWVNGAAFGAVGDSTTNNTPAIQAALNATPMGGVCYLPAGDYGIAAPLVVAPGKTLMMAHANLMASPPNPAPQLTDPPCRLKLLPTFTGAAAIVFQDAETGGYPKVSAEQRLIDVMIDGSAVTAPAVDGIQAKGNVQNITLRGVTIRYMSGNGIYTDINTATGRFPYSWRLYRIMVDNCKGHGYAFNVMTDITLFDCQAIGNGANGFQLNNMANSHMALCRSEWNGNYGFNFTGDWGTGWGAGALAATVLSTDRNGWDGIHFDATGTTPFILSSVMLRRDGRNNNAGGGGYAAFSSINCTTPLVITGLTVYPGTDDGGAGTNSPEFGLKITGTNTITLDHLYLHAATTPYSNTNLNTQLGPNVTTMTGTTAAPAPAVAPAWGWKGPAHAQQALPASNVLTSTVTGEAFPRAVLQANGTLVLGGGTLAPDTPGWYREVAGNLKTNSYVAMEAGGQAGGAFTSWAAAPKALVAGSPGGGFSVSEGGAAARMGITTLTAGTKAIANTSVTATSRIFLQRQAVGGAPGHLSYTRQPGVGFTVTSTSNTETSTLNWLIVEPA